MKVDNFLTSALSHFLQSHTNCNQIICLYPRSQNTKDKLNNAGRVLRLTAAKAWQALRGPWIFNIYRQSPH